MNAARNASFLCTLLALAAAPACSAERGREAPADSASATAAAAAQDSGAAAAPGVYPAPPGSLKDWIADIRAGLEQVRTESRSDRRAAQQTAARAYVERQEAIEAYYGASGTLSPPQEVADAVTEAETRFHHLLALLGTTDSVQMRERLPASLDSLLEQYRIVEARVSEAGLPLTPPRPDSAGSGASK